MQLFVCFSAPSSCYQQAQNKSTIAKLCLCSLQPSNKKVFLFVVAQEEELGQEVSVLDSSSPHIFLKLAHI